MHDPDHKFSQIKKAYAEFEQRLRDSGKGLVCRTQKGIYATTNLDAVFRFFREIGLNNYSRFLDLGCGDGRVVLVASLFTKATGIEYTKELVDVADTIKQNLELDCEFIVGDYLDHDLTKYDLVFINPDHDFNRLDTRLREELGGPLFVYNDFFAPALLKKSKEFWPGRIPIIKYTKD